ncbi:AT-hook-containing transcription factor [Channa argus]|uniref:AT-hook-containing transcription factor n=1 Tax=Channa argus TaxID=215402 RepID=A0A6G1QIA2_CHAAH|nr:AT-hook-containing transcription factor [Channa argus]
MTLACATDNQVTTPPAKSVPDSPGLIISFTDIGTIRFRWINESLQHSSVISEDVWEDESVEQAEKGDGFVSQMDDNGIIGLSEPLENVELGKACGDADADCNPCWFHTLLTPEEADPSGYEKELLCSLSKHLFDTEFPGEDVQILSTCDITGSLKTWTGDEQVKSSKDEQNGDEQGMSSGSRRQKKKHTSISGEREAMNRMTESYINKGENKKISSTQSCGCHTPAVEPAGVSSHHCLLSESVTAPTLPHLLHFSAEEIAAAPGIEFETFPDMGFTESLPESLSSKMSIKSSPHSPNSERDEQKGLQAAAIIPKQVRGKTPVLKSGPDRPTKTPSDGTKAAEMNESRKVPMSYRTPDFSKVEPRVRFPKSGYKPPKSRLSVKSEFQSSGPPTLFKSPVDIVKDVLMDTTDAPPAPSTCNIPSTSAPSLTLPEDFRSWQQATTLLEQLQEDYNRLLTKYAEAENTIDRLRLEAKLAKGLDSLERGYLLARDEHRRLQQQQATKISKFDPERELEGLIFQCGLYVDEIKEQVEEMQQEQPICEAPPSPPSYPMLSSLSSEGGKGLMHPQTPPVPLLVDPGRPAKLNVSSTDEEINQKEEEADDEETMKAFYLKTLTGKHRYVEQDFATIMDDYQSFKELPKIVNHSLREGNLRSTDLGSNMQPENERQDAHSQGRGNLEFKESLSQRKVKSDNQDLSPYRTEQQTSRFTPPSGRAATQSTTLPVHPPSSCKRLAVGFSHSSSLSSLGESTALERKNSKLQTESSRVLSQCWISQTDESKASSLTSGLESDTTHSSSEDGQIDQNAESINSVHSTHPCSSPTVQYHHGDPLRALGLGQVVNHNDAMQLLQEEVRTLKEKLESLRNKNPLNFVRSSPSTQDKYTLQYSSTPHISFLKYTRVCVAGQHRAVSIQVSETGNEPDRSCQAPLCSQRSSHQRGQTQYCFGDLDPPIHPSWDPAESPDRLVKNRFVAAAAPPVLLKCMPMCPPPFLNSSGMSSRVRSGGEVKGKTRWSMSADKQHPLDSSLNRAIRAAQQMKHTSGHMARSLSSGLQYQEVLTQFCNY